MKESLGFPFHQERKKCYLFPYQVIKTTQFLGCFHWGSGGSFLGVFTLILSEGSQTALGSAFEDGLAILIHLQFNDDALDINK